MNKLEITPRQARRSILLVDDDLVVLDLLTHLFQRDGYATERAVSAEDALTIIARQEPDLALLDIVLPGMSGLDLARRLQTETTVPFMFLTGQNDMALVREATGCGALGYLVKPFTREQILPAIEAALASADEIRHLRRTEFNLTAALAAGRETSMAVGLLMAKFQTDRNTAFEVLRDYARSGRRRLNDVAKTLLAAEETLNALQPLITKARNNK
ncbi:MAG TPA: response regulator [Noviherbaspirillum sp.]|uniref:ANTAR domain-containing response regulator n=1 Tax=Noviherbaspirillum sp. TaxID=1926288 RepID=UPI002B476E3F|nr:response regulator [Noviherbaspirillum sp.]HJV87660.1 response regulator [Noviherbaspirillum sp.]